MKRQAVVLSLLALMVPLFAIAAPIEILAPQTGAAQVGDFEVSGTDSHPKLFQQVTVSIYSSSTLADTDYVDLQSCVTEDVAGACTAWKDVNFDDKQARLRKGNDEFVVKGDGRYRFDKDVTSVPVGIYLKTRRSK